MMTCAGISDDRPFPARTIARANGGSIGRREATHLKLLFDAGTERLLGVHVVGAGASELVHIGQAFLECDADATKIAETLYNYPTLSDLYRHAALEALVALGRIRSSGAGGPS